MTQSTGGTFSAEKKGKHRVRGQTHHGGRDRSAGQAHSATPKQTFQGGSLCHSHRTLLQKQPLDSLGKGEGQQGQQVLLGLAPIHKLLAIVKPGSRRDFVAAEWPLLQLREELEDQAAEGQRSDVDTL